MTRHPIHLRFKFSKATKIHVRLSLPKKKMFALMSLPWNEIKILGGLKSLRHRCGKWKMSCRSRNRKEKKRKCKEIPPRIRFILLFFICVKTEKNLFRTYRKTRWAVAIWVMSTVQNVCRTYQSAYIVKSSIW